MRRLLIILMALALSLALIFSACAPAAPAPAPAPPKPAPAPPKPAPAPVSPAEFYKNNPVTILCTYAAGGGTDFATRLFASYWSEATGGAMIVKNVPGGGHLQAVFDTYNAKPDGLTMLGGIWGSNVLNPALQETPGVKFDIDITKFNYIGAIVGDEYEFAVGIDSPYESMEDLQKVEGLKFGATSATGGMSRASVLVAEFFGLKGAKVVAGYGGAGEVALAAAKGELDGQSNSAFAIDKSFKDGMLKYPFVTIGVKRSAIHPDVPAISELAKLTPEQEQVLVFFAATQRGHKIFLTTPGVPEDRVKFARDAFDKIMTMKGFLKQAKVWFPVWPEPTRGEEIAVTVEQAMKLPKEPINLLNQYVEKYLK